MDQAFEMSMFWTPLGHNYLIIFEQKFGVYGLFAGGTQAAGRFEKSIILLFSLGGVNVKF